MNHSKYPKKLGEAVLNSTKRQHENNAFEIAPHKYNENTKSSQKKELVAKKKELLDFYVGVQKENKIAELEKGLFELQGAFPYMFDAINYACTHNKDGIRRIGDNQETHYQMVLPVSVFYEYALDGLDQYKDALEHELHRVMFNNPSKMLPVNDTMSILTQPIRMSVLYDDNTKGIIQNIKKTEGKTIKAFIIEFYKPLWASLLEDSQAKAWFLTPKSFYAKIKKTIEGREEEFLVDTRVPFPSAINILKLFIYLAMHDNRNPNDMRDTKIEHNTIDLLQHCFPSCFTKKTDGSYVIRNWQEARAFILAGLKVFNDMAKNELMNGIPLVPYGIEYNDTNVRISIQRDTKKPISLFIRREDLGKTMSRLTSSFSWY